ncbi:hypothetical protein GCM10007913_11560 [Devosia yakushimensis]|uniref:Uncharacterized protein n=1 Tax=Devosia yakushimensis TaxID=470028 RepID=A0ABQ5UBH9_9HYPH|nr:hypothetical protein [Devosia yakushimensis]GLQ09224.1 hypothetical protein GCM10007913_11560 [Devosia yakushimensis]
MADDSSKQRREIEERRLATTIINMLPEDPDSALRVLDFAKELVEGFLRPRNERRVYSIRAVKDASSPSFTVPPPAANQKGE